MSFNVPQLIGQFGLQNTKLGQGVIGYKAEEEKFTNQLYVLGILLFALVLGIIAVVLFSTGVSELESYSNYFESTGHKVAIGFAIATLISLFVAGVMLDSALECAEDTRARQTGRSSRPPSPQMPNIIGTIPPYQRQPVLSSPVYRPPTPPPAYPRPVYRAPVPNVVYQQRPPSPRPPPNAFVRQPVAVPLAQQPGAFPTVPTSPIPSPVVAYPPIPQQTPTTVAGLTAALPGLINAAAPIALAAVNAQQGQRGQAAFQALAGQQLQQ